MRDIGERRVAHQRALHDALHDPLTQVANRRGFLERLDDELRDATPDDAVGVLFVDVDYFKLVNDRLGHDAGDQVLVEVARTLSRLLRPSDLVARFGGDEFTVLLNDVADPARATEIAERITAELARPLSVEGREVTISVSVGVAVCRGRATGAEQLIRNADQAMYRAKRNGRARWESFDAAPAELS
jgi:diguanylate cyclase (GGDEF)-like protein